MKKNISLWCAGLILAPSLAMAQPMTLKSATESAILSNPEVLSRWHVFKAAENERDAASGAFLPRLDLSAGAGRENRDDPLLQRDYTRSSTSLTLTQMLYDGFATRNDVNRLGHARLVRALELQDSVENTAMEAARAYFDVLRYRELTTRAEDNYVMHRSMFEPIQNRVQAGVGRRVDLEQAAGRLALAEANLLTETSNLHDVSARFQRITGTTPPNEMEGISKLSEGIPGNAEAALKAAQTSNPALRAAIENVRAALSASSVRRAAYQPRVDLRLNTMTGKDLNGYSGNHHIDTAEVVLNWNLFNGFSDQARSRQYVEQADAARSLRDKTCRDVRQTLAIAYNDVRKLNEQLKYLEQHQLSIEKARDAYRDQFDIGQRTLLDLLDTENELFQAKRAYINAEYDLAIAYVRTHAGMGHTLSALGISTTTMAKAEELDQWVAAEDAPTQCPPDSIKVYSADKESLNARAMAMQKDISTPIPAAPVVITPENQVAQAMKDWAAAWSTRNIPAYLDAYAPDFTPVAGISHQSWAAKRKEIITRAKEISLDLSKLKIVVHSPQHATANFQQDYHSTAYTDSVLKTLEWKKSGERWRIVREAAEPAPQQ